MQDLACKIAEKTVWLFGHVLMVASLVLASIGSLLWVVFCFILHYPAELAFTIHLSILALLIGAAIQNSAVKDTLAIQKKLDGLIKSSDADDELAGLEKKL